MSTFIVLDQCASNVQNVWHFVLKKKKIPFVVIMAKLSMTILITPLSIQCSMSFIWAQHLNLESFLNPFESIIKLLHLQVCVVNFNLAKLKVEGYILFV